MKVIIAGSREFASYFILKEFCDKMLANQTDIEIVSGTARGADRLGEEYAKERGYPIKRFPADWSKGKSGGYIRNREMSLYADALIAFWDKKSPGTRSMIELAKEHGLAVRICYV